MTEPTTIDTIDSKLPNPTAGQSQDKGKSLHELPIYYVSKASKDQNTRTVQPLNAAARNEIAHKNPDLLKRAKAEALESLKRQANKEGLFEDTDCLVRWKPSTIPFHIEFETSASGEFCQHLVCVKNIPGKDPVSMQICTSPSHLTLGIGTVREKTCSTCKALSKQATCKLT